MDKPSYMSDVEFKDLEEMKDKVNQRKINAIDYSISVLRYDENDLRACGHKTIEGMIRYIVENCKKDIDKLNKEYIRKYPD